MDEANKHYPMIEYLALLDLAFSELALEVHPIGSIQLKTVLDYSY